MNHDDENYLFKFYQNSTTAQTAKLINCKFKKSPLNFLSTSLLQNFLRDDVNCYIKSNEFNLNCLIKKTLNKKLFLKTPGHRKKTSRTAAPCTIYKNHLEPRLLACSTIFSAGKVDNRAIFDRTIPN